MIFLRLPVLATLMLLVFSAPALAQDKPVFRNFIWGIGKDDVRAFETAKWYKDEGNSSFYVIKPDQFRRTIRYDFRNGKLWRAYYGYNDLHFSNTQKVYDEGVKEQLRLIEMYGEPAKEEIVWIRTRYRKPQRLDAAFRSGDIRIRTTWELPDTKVVMELYHDGMFFQLHYTVEETTAPDVDSNRNILNLPLGNNPQP